MSSLVTSYYLNSPLEKTQLYEYIYSIQIVTCA